MDVTAILNTLNEKASAVDPIGATLKMKVDEHTIFVDGTGDTNVVSAEDKEADCTIKR